MLIHPDHRTFNQFIISVLIIFLAFGGSLKAQESLDSNMVRSILKQSEKKEKRLNRLLNIGELTHAIQVTYQLDEFQIEEYLNRKIQRDPSSANYISQLILAEKRYQMLMGKYYEMLSSKLNETDQEILEITQARWHGYKQYEQAVNKMINPEAYKLKALPMEKLAERHLDITKFRVMELADYIARLSEE